MAPRMACSSRSRTSPLGALRAPSFHSVWAAVVTELTRPWPDAAVSLPLSAASSSALTSRPSRHIRKAFSKISAQQMMDAISKPIMMDLTTISACWNSPRIERSRPAMAAVSAKRFTTYLESFTFESDDVVRRCRQLSAAPASALHSITSLIRNEPILSQAMPSRSNSLTVRLLGFDGREIERDAAADDAVSLKQHEVELVGLVNCVGRIVDDHVGAAALFGRLELVEFERDGGRRLQPLQWRPLVRQRRPR